MKLPRLALTAAVATVAIGVSLSAMATHSWNNYHWARTTSSFTLQVIDSTTPDWDDELNLAVQQWSQAAPSLRPGRATRMQTPLP